MIRGSVEKQMQDKDKERMEFGPPLTERKELMTMAREEKSAILKLEAEYRVAGMPRRSRAGVG